LPDPDGHVGQVIVTTSGGTVDISEAGESTIARGREAKPDTPELLTEQEIQEEFSDVLARLPVRPVHHILYFRSESTRLTAASKKTIRDVLAAIKERESVNISVVGHTDTAGDEGYNRQLSLKRAKAVKALLVKKGIDPDSIETSSHGEHNLLIKTDDNTHEAKNRRVEVVVR
jgi:outer membrane protein OmpA-like peptidoglycan-associated protein